MRKAKLPTTKDKLCSNCHAVVIHSYDYQNGIFMYKCSGCACTRYQANVMFETRFIAADQI